MKKYHFSLFFLLILLSACNSEPQGGDWLDKLSLSEPETVEFLKLGLFAEDDKQRTYQMRVDDSVAFTQTHYVKTERTREGLRYQEVYNVYQDSGLQRVELYVSDFVLKKGKGKDSLHWLNDLRVIAKPQKAYIEQGNASPFFVVDKKRLALGEKYYTIYRMHGYSPLHISGDSLPGRQQPPDYVKYWNPELGTLKVEYDSLNVFELAACQQLATAELRALIGQLQ
jgi:hypothetical protein